MAKKVEGIRARKQRMRVESAHLARRLKELRTERKISQMDIAKKLQIARNAYGAWEEEDLDKQTEPSLGQIEAVAILLGTTPEYLSFGIGEKHASRKAEERRDRYRRSVTHNGLGDLKQIKPLPMSVHVLTREGILDQYQDQIDQSLGAR